MTAIATQGTGLRHVRKTIAFDGSANNGNLGDDVPVFTITGRVMIERWTAYCSEDLVSAAGAATRLQMGVTSNTSAITGGTQTFISDFATNRWWNGREEAVAQGYAESANIPRFATIDENVVLNVFDNGGGADVTDGTLVIDCWYRPITDNGALAGDDIDTELIAAMLTTAMTESYNADGAAPTLAQALFGILQGLTEFSISGTTLTVKKLDGSTTAMTFTLNSASAPTSRTRAT